MIFKCVLSCLLLLPTLLLILVMLKVNMSGTDGESSMETYTLTYVKEIASGNLLYDSRNSNWSSVTT